MLASLFRFVYRFAFMRTQYESLIMSLLFLFCLYLIWCELSKQSCCSQSDASLAVSNAKIYKCAEGMKKKSKTQQLLLALHIRWIGTKYSQGTNYTVSRHEHNSEWIGIGALLQTCQSRSRENWQNLCLLPDPFVLIGRKFFNLYHCLQDEDYEKTYQLFHR